MTVIRCYSIKIHIAKIRYLYTISLILITLASYGQGKTEYTTGPSFWGGTYLSLNNNGEYEYATSSCTFTARVYGEYVQLGNWIILTSYEDYPTEKRQGIITYQDKFTDEDFIRIKLMMKEENHITKIDCNVCTELYPKSYYRFLRAAIF